MKNTFLLVVCTLIFTSAVSAQTKSLETASRQLQSLKADKQITLSHEAASGSGRIMYVAENFSDADASRAGIQAMNFAAGFFFTGSELKTAPDPVKLTFWVKSKKPRFAASHGLTIYADGEVIELGDSRYTAKADRNMEYLNFEVSREVLKSIAERSTVKIRLGVHEFTLTPGQIKGLAELLLVSDPAWAG